MLLDLILYRFRLHRYCSNSQQPTVNSQQSTVNSQQSTANSQQSTANSQQSTANSQQSTVNSQQPTVNSQQSTANSQQSTVNNYLGTPAVKTSWLSNVTRTSSSILTPIPRHFSGTSGCPSTGLI